MKVHMLKFPPELNDGDKNWIVHPRYLNHEASQGVIEQLSLFASEGEVGDEVVITIVEMTEEEYEKIPEC